MMKDGTYTMKKEKLSYQDGFQVGLVEGTYALVKNQQEIDGVWAGIIENYSPCSIGVWVDKHGLTHVDPCCWVKSLELAKALGRQNKQKAIWCWVTMKEIHL